MKSNTTKKSESCQRTTARTITDYRNKPCTSSTPNTSQIISHHLHVKPSKSRGKAKAPLLDNVNLNTSSEEEDDDVICIPAPPPPLVCIESTDDENDNKSIATADDNNFDRIEEDVSQVSGITTAELERNSIDEASSNLSPTKHTYDTYESECSDLTNTTSESDCSSIPINTKNRSKRMIKLKSSSSSNGSDTTDGTDSDDEGMLFLDIVKDTSTPYLQRGEAIRNVNKSFANNKRLETRLNESANHQSEDETLPMLSCIVHDKAVALLNVTNDEPSINKTNEDSLSIDSRQVAENVLEKTIKTGDEQLSNIEERTAERSKIDEDHAENIRIFAVDNEPNHEQSSSIAEMDSALPESATTTAIEPNGTDKWKKDYYVQSVPVDPEIGWNDEMKCFYHNSWGGENFNVTVSQRPMTNFRHEWDILDDDREPSQNNRNSELRCFYCGEIDHMVKDCSLLPRQIKCHMCGEVGHREPRCPHSMCLRCGSPTSTYRHGCDRCQHFPDKICALCKTRGHGVPECPDIWRRYHSTIVPGQPLTKLPLIFHKTRYCCICAGKGHTAEYCPDALSTLDTPSMRIVSYCNVYDPIVQENTDEDVARFALISAPVKDVQFSYDIDESPNRFYGRMMAATNISRQQNELKENDTNSALLMASSAPNRSVRTAKTKKRVREAEYAAISGPAAKVRKGQSRVEDETELKQSQQRQKRKRSDIEEQLRDDNELNEFLADVNASNERINSTFEEGIAGPSLILKEPQLNHTDELKVAIRHGSKPNTKLNELERNTENFEQNHIEEGVISLGVDKATLPAKRYRFDSDSSLCCSKENPQTFEITKSVKELTSFKDSNIEFAENIPTGISSVIQVDVHQDLSNIISHPADETQMRLAEEATTETEKKAYAWKITPKKLPPNRLRLIEFIEGHLSMLQKPHGNVDELYQRMCVQIENEKIQGAARTRRKLNVLLMGQTGLRKGSTHLKLLHSIVKSLYSSKKSFVSLKRRMDVFRHYQYIFTPFEHDDYPGLITDYKVIHAQRSKLFESVEGAEVNNVYANNKPARRLPNANLESTDRNHLAKENMCSDNEITGGNCNPSSRSPAQFPENDTDVPTSHHTIYMTSAHYNCLTTPNTFLAATYSKHDVVVRVKDFQFCVIFLVEGNPVALRNLLKDLIDYNENKFSTERLIYQPLIKFFKSEFKSLKSNWPQAGNTILTGSEHNEIVRIEWHYFGTMLIAEGTTHAQNRFRNRLIAFCQNDANKTRWSNELKYRTDMIRFIEHKLTQLEKSSGNVSQLYEQMCLYESDMYSTEEADRTRTLLNIILMGQAGLRNGAFHLKALQYNLNSLVQHTARKVPKKIQSDAFRHYNYIFSPFVHYNYPGLITVYEALPNNRLEPNRSVDEASPPIGNTNLELNDKPHLELLGSADLSAPMVYRDMDNVDVTNKSAVLPAGNANMESNDKYNLTSLEYDKDVPTTIDRHTIYMSKANYKCLKYVLPEAYAKHDVVVLVKHFEFCVIFLVDGEAGAQNDFYKDLIYYSTKRKTVMEKPTGQSLKQFFMKEIKQSDLHRPDEIICTGFEHDDGVHIEWYCFGRMFIVKGTAYAQNNFRNRLSAYCQDEARLVRWVQEHRNRLDMIRFIETRLNTLKNPCGNVRLLYKEMRAYENDLHSSKYAARSRALLNTILMGQAGLRNGSLHLNALQSALTTLLTCTQCEVPEKLHNDLFQHWEYIFTPIVHDDYPGLINEFEQKFPNQGVDQPAHVSSLATGIYKFKTINCIVDLPSKCCPLDDELQLSLVKLSTQM